MNNLKLLLKETEQGRGCLVPKPGVSAPSCHEFSKPPPCDCEILRMISIIRAMEKAIKTGMTILERDRADEPWPVQDCLKTLKQALIKVEKLAKEAVGND